ncbi:hypothetical protein ABIA71_001459 [Stenotrophomonas sp. 2619]|uniref:hypothetical protein n=1 Tax=Stenotrophomonas sp. 2619 TaxID=3156316 RepID=UPI003393C941
MNLIRPVLICPLLAVSLFAAADANAGDARYLGLLNRAHDSVVALEVAPAGSDAFVARPIAVLPGGGGSSVVRLGDQACRFDLRMTFGNGRRAVYHAVDVCRGDTLAIQPLPRSRTSASVAGR